MFEWIYTQNLVVMALIATLGTWLATAAGAGLVFFFKEINLKLLNTMLGFAAGIMIAASFWSLLAPAIDMAESSSLPAWLVAAIGFMGGACFLWIADQWMPESTVQLNQSNQNDPTLMQWKRSIMLVFSITLHNIPEGLAVGVAFGAIGLGEQNLSVLSAFAVAIGIGLQNIPEGAAVSIPLRREGVSRWKSFVYGQASGFVEPIAGVAGAALVSQVQPILPYALAFAAGAMIYVAVEELIPTARASGADSSRLVSIGCVLGFTIMMILDVALG